MRKELVQDKRLLVAFDVFLPFAVTAADTFPQAQIHLGLTGVPVVSAELRVLLFDCILHHSSGGLADGRWGLPGADSPRTFWEAFWMLLGGAGRGPSPTEWCYVGVSPFLCKLSTSALLFLFSVCLYGEGGPLARYLLAGNIPGRGTTITMEPCFREPRIRGPVHWETVWGQCKESWPILSE